MVHRMDSVSRAPANGPAVRCDRIHLHPTAWVFCILLGGMRFPRATINDGTGWPIHGLPARGRPGRVFRRIRARSFLNFRTRRTRRHDEPLLRISLASRGAAVGRSGMVRGDDDRVGGAGRRFSRQHHHRTFGGPHRQSQERRIYAPSSALGGRKHHGMSVHASTVFPARVRHSG